MSAAVANSEIDVLIQDTLILIHDQVIWISLWGTALAISNVTFLKASFSNKKSTTDLYPLFNYQRNTGKCTDYDVTITRVKV